MLGYSYDTIKQHYESIKPIRGRANDIRPAGDRRKDWMRVTMGRSPTGETTYGYSLYGSEVITVYPDNSMTLNTGGWSTSATASFLTTYSPFRCMLSSRRVWAIVSGMAVPLDKKPLRITVHPDEQPMYRPEITSVLVRSINRPIAKELRARLDPLIKYGEVMLKLSDGWITDATMRSLQDSWAAWCTKRGLLSPRVHMNLEMLLTLKSEEDLAAGFGMVLTQMDCVDSRASATQDPSTYRNIDRRYSLSAFKRTVHKIHDAHDPRVYRIDRVPLSEKLHKNLVP